MGISVFIDCSQVCYTIKRGRSTVSWQELSKRERNAVIGSLESVLSDHKRRVEDDGPKKYCGKCKRLLPLSAFYKRSDNGKPRSFCKECEMDYGRRYRAKISKRCYWKSRVITAQTESAVSESHRQALTSENHV